jgi:macrolide transport system ATP-binding/permease protein
MGAQLIVFELAATMVLLVGAGLLGKSLYKLLNVDIGFVPSHLAKLQVFAPTSKYSNDEQAVALHKQVVTRLQALPGVLAVGTANGLTGGLGKQRLYQLCRRAQLG